MLYMFGYELKVSIETLFFILVICVVTFLFCKSYWKSPNIENRQQIAHHAPTILTTLGIFATFFSIALGLLYFDATNIQKGIPALLNSLKTAFWASVFGVGGAIFVKIMCYLYPPESNDQDIDKLITELKSLHYAETQQGKDHQDELLEELKALRIENNEHLTQLVQTQDEALERLAEMGTQTLISALEEVVRDFNNNITEQFGDNFKQLNEAVGEILIWQENYKAFVDDTSESLESLITSLNETIEDFDSIVTNSQAFSETAEELASTIQYMQQHHDESKAYLEKLANMITDANNGLPSIENKIIQITTQIQAAMQENNRLLNQATQETKSNVDELNKGMEKALSDALQQITGHLGALSEKFANDYSPITTHLEQIVKLAQRR